MKNNKIRIIGGEFRSRLITVPDEAYVRPTPNRIRETIFNWLREDIPGTNCLDLFAGSGALGFEAISRGAASVTFIEKEKIAYVYLKKNNAELKIEHSKFIPTDALTFLKQYKGPTFDIVFLDPPYAENLIVPCLTLLTSRDLLSKQAKIYIEHDKPFDYMDFPEGLTLLKSKKACKVYYGLLIS